MLQYNITYKLITIILFQLNNSDYLITYKDQKMKQQLNNYFVHFFFCYLVTRLITIYIIHILAQQQNNYY